MDCDGGCLLLRDVGPVPGSGHHGLGIDGSKSKVVAEFETSSIGGQVIHSQYVRIRGVDYQILHISPCQIRTVQTQSERECSYNFNTTKSTHFACRARAITPEVSGAEALVPVKLSVHFPSNVVV